MPASAEPLTRSARLADDVCQALGRSAHRPRPGLGWRQLLSVAAAVQSRPGPGPPGGIDRPDICDLTPARRALAKPWWRRRRAGDRPAVNLRGRVSARPVAVNYDLHLFAGARHYFPLDILGKGGGVPGSGRQLRRPPADIASTSSPHSDQACRCATNRAGKRVSSGTLPVRALWSFPGVSATITPGDQAEDGQGSLLQVNGGFLGALVSMISR